MILCHKWKIVMVYMVQILKLQSLQKGLEGTNEHNYLGDGTIIREDELEVGRQYTFIKGETMPYGSMVHLEELPCKYGYQAYLFEELQPYDEEILEGNYRQWLREKLDEAEEDRKEGRIYSMKEFRSIVNELRSKVNKSK